MTQPPVNPEFTQFGPAHLVTIVLLVAVCAVLSILVRRANSAKTRRTICWIVAALLLGTEWLHYILTLACSGTGAFIEDCLPLHACGMAVYMTAYALITRKQLIFEVVYFLAFGGTTQAILTPALELGFPTYRFFQFFIAHALVITGVCVLTFGLKMRPRLKGLWFTYALTWMLVFLVGGINYLLDTNFMYLCRPPIGVSPFYFLDWPWYILFQGGLALVVFFLLWLPFCKFRT